ncbi:hypothetical protein QYF61_017549 [Mycteria americana]|uniref:Uncharacterized protein n=1 Tax=Mycteria americana TaxID=33587 RepID=A0AAN7NQ25_MYCAM|nr:hypothetical protein QYF61_017549 [Mycteria americana]
MECWVHPWAPKCKKDMDVLEQAQQRATEMQDDSKLGRPIDMLKSRAAIQRGLETLDEWVNRNLMKCNEDKCKVLHL